MVGQVLSYAAERMSDSEAVFLQNFWIANAGQFEQLRGLYGTGA